LSNSKSDMLFSLGNIVSSGTAQYWKNLTSFYLGRSPALPQILRLSGQNNGDASSLSDAQVDGHFPVS